jgi:predicted lipid carrier protein YhbT
MIRPLGLLPEAPPSLALAAALNFALARGLASREVFAPLAGKVLRLEASDLGAGVNVGFDGRRFRPRLRRGPADVTVRASSRDYVQLALRREDPDTLFFSRRLLITGDTDLGLVVKNALDAIEWSFVPLLNRLLAHSLLNANVPKSPPPA